jgi:hypothetical protein
MDVLEFNARTVAKHGLQSISSITQSDAAAVVDARGIDHSGTRVFDTENDIALLCTSCDGNSSSGLAG